MTELHSEYQSAFKIKTPSKLIHTYLSELWDKCMSIDSVSQRMQHYTIIYNLSANEEDVFSGLNKLFQEMSQYETKEMYFKKVNIISNLARYLDRFSTVRDDYVTVKQIAKQWWEKYNNY
jgi:hypothetical protein